MSRDVRTRAWLFVFYPESAPAEWREIVAEWQLGVYISPLHDMDFRQDGSLKKPHFHGILCFDGPQTYSRALGLVSELGCATCKPCNSLQGAVRYLCHLDSPDKAQYEIEDIELFGPVSLDVIEIKSENDIDRKFSELIGFIDEFNIVEFSVLCNYILINCPNLFRILRSNVQFFKAYLSSKRAILSA